MRKYLLSSVFCGLCVLGIQAQVTLKGVAVKMNSDFTPVAGVEVVVKVVCLLSLMARVLLY